MGHRQQHRGGWWRYGLTTMDFGDPIGRLLAHVREVHPNLRIESVTSLHGQFNEALIVNDSLVFRFPRSHHATLMLKDEVAVLRAIRPLLTWSIPEPEYGDLAGDAPFVGYRMIPGEPLRRDAFAALDDVTVLQRLADQLAAFLHELHSVPLDALGSHIPRRDSRQRWLQMYDDVRLKLMPLMRPDAREEVRQHFESYLADPERLSFTPALRHGDFGAGNILWQPESGALTGVIDFSFAGIGDPAIDAAAISTLGESFLQRMFNDYPALESMLDRVRFYRGTYALTEALDGLRDDDQEHFESGIRGYR